MEQLGKRVLAFNRNGKGDSIFIPLQSTAPITQVRRMGT